MINTLGIKVVGRGNVLQTVLTTANTTIITEVAHNTSQLPPSPPPRWRRAPGSRAAHRGVLRDALHGLHAGALFEEED